MLYQTGNPAILITTYIRYEKLARCITSIQRCELYEEYDIHIFSDGARSPADDLAVKETRSFLKSLKGDNIHLYFADTNNGSRRQGRNGMKRLKKLGYSSYVFLEEDIIVSTTYLAYMTEHLNRFANDKNVKAISAFTHAAFLDEINKSPYRSYRFSPWGFGSWFDRDLWKEHLSDGEIEEKLKSFRFKRQLINCGYDVLPNIIYPLIQSKIVQGDYRATMMSVWFCDYSIYPRSSKVYNIGLDGSGMNCSDLNLSEDFSFGDNREFIKDTPKILIRTSEFLYVRNWKRITLSYLLLIMPYNWVKTLYTCFLRG